jgi:hypothetical protein
MARSCKTKWEGMCEPPRSLVLKYEREEDPGVFGVFFF